jgi:hypothetical protein
LSRLGSSRAFAFLHVFSQDGIHQVIAPYKAQHPATLEKMLALDKNAPLHPIEKGSAAHMQPFGNLFYGYEFTGG